jgi:hypothetical protein
METLGSLIKEISLVNKLQLNSYQNVVEARKQIEYSIRQSAVEYNETRKKMSILVDKGKRDKDGVLITQMTIYNLSLKYKEVVKNSMETLEMLQDIERSMLRVLNSKNIDFIETDEVEDKQVMISRWMNER